MQVRNTRLDLLRIFSMVGIVALHIIGVGGVASVCEVGTLNCWITKALEIICECSVNVFAVMSGYLLFGKRQKMKRLFELLVTVLFYCIIITLVMILCFDVPANVKNIIYGLLPMLRGRYWYITCYVGLFLIFPYINSVLERLDKKQYSVLLLVLTAVFSFIPNFVTVDLFGTENGYSVAWLAICYIFGAFWRKFDFRLFDGKEWLIFAASSLCLIAGKAIIYFAFNSNMDYFITYTSPFILLNALMLLQWAVRKKPCEAGKFANFIRYISALSFDVYIIHSHPLVFDYLFKDVFSWIAELNALLTVPIVIGISVLIYAACCPVAAIREKLFSIKIIDKPMTLISRKADLLISFKETEYVSAGD